MMMRARGFSGIYPVCAVLLLVHVSSLALLLAADNEVEVRIRDIIKASKKATTASELTSFSKELAEIADTAIRDDDLPNATKAASVASDLLLKSERRHLAFRAKQRKDEVLAIAKEFKGLAKYTKKLGTSPDDAEANHKAGLYTAVIKEDWQRGATMLEKAGTPLLTQISKGELQPPTEPADQLLLGEAWSAAADEESGLIRSRMKKRAHHWIEPVYRNGSGELRKKADAALAQLPYRYLSDMEELDKGEGSWPFGKYGEIGSSLQARIKIDDISYDMGLGVVPLDGKPFPVKYKLGGKYKSIQGGCGLNDTSEAFNGAMHFSLTGDGRPLWTSGPIKSRSDVEFFNVNVKDIQTVELRIECMGNVHGGHTAWLDPLVSK